MFGKTDGHSRIAKARKKLSFSDIVDLSISKNTSQVISFTLDNKDFPELTCAGSVSISSSDTAVIESSGIVLSGTAPARLKTRRVQPSPLPSATQIRP
jgi:hypothetical protein